MSQGWQEWDRYASRNNSEFTNFCPVDSYTGLHKVGIFFVGQLYFFLTCPGIVVEY